MYTTHATIRRVLEFVYSFHLSRTKIRVGRFAQSSILGIIRPTLLSDEYKGSLERAESQYENHRVACSFHVITPITERIICQKALKGRLFG